MILTVGGKFTLPISWLPIFQLLCIMQLERTLRHLALKGTPNKIKSSIDVGLSITPKVGSKTWMSLEVNYKDIAGVHKIQKGWWYHGNSCH